MDAQLIAWARRVKRRAPPHLRVPPLWLFTEAAMMPDLPGLVARLPAGLCGVVFRHDGVPGRAALGLRVARACRAGRLALVVAGDVRLAWALRAGVHLRGGKRGLVRLPPGRLVTASAHDRADCARARRGAVVLVFISPVFPTSSHPGMCDLGPPGWRRLAAAAAPSMPAALGGVTGQRVRQLGPHCRTAGAIGALLY
jgi:thiamine-phosphate pyrophosphorylase